MKIIFARSGTLTSLFIRWFTWSKWSHVGIVLDNKVVHATGGKGVAIEPLKDLISRSKDYELAEIPGEESLALEQVGKEYDNTAVFGVRWGAWDDPDKWFCSELVAYASGLFRANMNKRVTPQHIYMVSKCTN